MDPNDKSHSSAIAGLHYRQTFSGNLQCLKKGCQHVVKVPAGADRKAKVKAYREIRTHCEKSGGCWPNLREAKNAATVQYNSNNRAQRRNINNKSQAKRWVEVKVEEKKAKAEGASANLECPICRTCFATESARRVCETKCNEVRKRCANRFITSCPMIQGTDQHDSQQTNESEESEFPQQLMESLEAQHNYYLKSTSWHLYFVVVVDASAKDIGLLKYLRQNSTNPDCTISYYVGKKTLTQKNDHDIMQDHLGRQYSSITEAIGPDKVAFEVHREYYGSLEALETAEASWILLGHCRKRVGKCTSRPQWIALNKNLPVSKAHVSLSTTEKKDVCSLAKKHHEIMCFVPNCTKDHNVRNRRYFGLFHCPEDEIKLHDPEQFNALKNENLPSTSIMK